ncbi:MAG: M23 family metallopeptidase [Candidatus Pacebacteria bacterium]|nr:M23 family metallopeptidase [Candidatus Paceibacterota bacterium]
MTKVSGAFIEISADIVEESNEVNSQSSVILSYNFIKNKKDIESFGGVDFTLEDGALKSKNITSIFSASEPFDIEELKKKNRYYIVQDGDNIATIAREFGVSQATIIWENDLKGTLIKPKQELVILPLSGLTHKVVKGDTLEKIAKKYKAKEEDIVDFNGFIENEEFKIGQKMVIPGGKKELPVKILAAKKSSTVKGNYAGYIVTKAGSIYKRYSSKRDYGYWTHPVPQSFRVRGITQKHHGVDMAAPKGTPILVAASGTVVKTVKGGWNGGCGSFVSVSHSNGARTLYCHMYGVSVFQGQKVIKGQKIGTVGSTGRSTGNHLHFEIRGATNPF